MVELFELNSNIVDIILNILSCFNFVGWFRSLFNIEIRRWFEYSVGSWVIFF